eukprot:TRINITY_DN48369_c0_g1_i1.p1 TRINITY_DN48369_c0_g1~~TRINITY_DN48369_c0_g1_i1.p1  ORF type:complete len:473 (-),score=52.64 TRINITY_DN48369_c0_g1_i1:110-1528(-)
MMPAQWGRLACWILLVGLYGVPGDDTKSVSASVTEAFNFLATQPFALSGQEVRVCHLGVGEHSVALSKKFLDDISPPPAQVVFLRAEDQGAIVAESLMQEYPGRVHMQQVLVRDSRCTIIVLALEDPRFTVDDIRDAGGEAEQTLLLYMNAHCSYERSHECRYFHSTWEPLTEGRASCGRSFCAAFIDTRLVQDPWLSMVDCTAATAVGGKEAEAMPASTISQWQQDWFVYQNFIRGTALDTSPASVSSPGFFVDVGGFHPIHLSNTAFFERCLGWSGVIVEPNPGPQPQFRAYRPRSRLVKNCVWSRPRSVTMSFQKDPIEAYIQEDPDGEDSSHYSGALPISGGGGRPEFKAECRTLQDILASQGLKKPAAVDYLSVDAEAAEVEIFRDFPFDEFDISVISVEVQVQNYYELDAIFLSAGYAKVAVLGGDHVYMKLKRPTALPVGTKEWHRALVNDFYTHAAPQTATAKG